MWKEKSGVSGVTFSANVLFGALLSYIILLCVVTQLFEYYKCYVRRKSGFGRREGKEELAVFQSVESFESVVFLSSVLLRGHASFWETGHVHVWRVPVKIQTPTAASSGTWRPCSASPLKALGKGRKQTQDANIALCSLFEASVGRDAPNSWRVCEPPVTVLILT